LAALNKKDRTLITRIGFLKPNEWDPMLTFPTKYLKETLFTMISYLKHMIEPRCDTLERIHITLGANASALLTLVPTTPAKRVPSWREAMERPDLQPFYRNDEHATADRYELRGP